MGLRRGGESLSTGCGEEGEWDLLRLQLYVRVCSSVLKVGVDA